MTATRSYEIPATPAPSTSTRHDSQQRSIPQSPVDGDTSSTSSHSDTSPSRRARPPRQARPSRRHYRMPLRPTSRSRLDSNLAQAPLPAASSDRVQTVTVPRLRRPVPACSVLERTKAIQIRDAANVTIATRTTLATNRDGKRAVMSAKVNSRPRQVSSNEWPAIVPDNKPDARSGHGQTLSIPLQRGPGSLPQGGQ